MNPRRRSRAAQGGQVLVLFALSLGLVLVPAVGLGIDASRTFEERRAAQIAVDQAALAAVRAACVPVTGTPPNPIDKGRAAALANGYNNGGLQAESGNIVTIAQVDGEDAGTDPDPYRYRAAITTRIPGTFSRMIGSGFNLFTVDVEAIADGRNCGTTGGGGGPGIGPIYAGGATCPDGSLNNIEISGNNHVVTGLTQSNGNFRNGGSGSTFNNSPNPAVKYVGSFSGGANTYTGTQQDIGPAVPTPQWPAGWGPTDMPTNFPTDLTNPFWMAYRNLAVNTDKSASSLNVTSSGVWYSDTSSDLDITGITAGVSIVVVAPRAKIKLPTDLSTSNLVGREFTPYNNAALPKQNVIVMSGYQKSSTEQCVEPAIEKSGFSGTFKGIFWAPRAVVRWSGNDATLHGCVIAWAFQMNGNDHNLNNDPTYCSSTGSPSANPEISLIK